MRRAPPRKRRPDAQAIETGSGRAACRAPVNIMSETAFPNRLLDERILHRLGRLRLVARRVRAGQMKGERRSTKRGTSIEFADYRDYVPGDDLRRVDWNVYARTERPYVKLHEEEEDLAVHVLLDASASMDWP